MAFQAAVSQPLLSVCYMSRQKSVLYGTVRLASPSVYYGYSYILYLDCILVVGDLFKQALPTGFQPASDSG